MAAGKWIDGLQADMPIDVAAAHVFAVRLGVLRDCIGPAITNPEEDVEHVHQLRVATRRADAAFELFAPCVSKKKFDKIRKDLRRIRKAAGPARDWDVYLIDLAKRKKKAEQAHWPGYDFLLGYGFAERVSAYGRLKQAGENKWFDGEQLIQTTSKAIEKPSPSEPQTLGELANPVTASLTKQLETAAAEDPSDIEHLHEIRIHAKQLRYAMELFECCFPAAFRERYYKAIEELQELLGATNDSFVAEQRLHGLAESIAAQFPNAWKDYQPGIEFLLEFHRARLADYQKRFMQWWTNWQQSGLSSGFWFLLNSTERIS